jgi:hypothetical protein
MPFVGNKEGIYEDFLVNKNVLCNKNKIVFIQIPHQPDPDPVSAKFLDPDPYSLQIR